MRRHLLSTILLSEVSQIIVASITGVTYMDQFDFEERYRDPNECNPFYWHPLHLPQKCIQMFEELIRSRLQTLMPYRIVTEKTNLDFMQSGIMYPFDYVYNPIYRTEYQPTEKRNLSPFEMMFELLRRDVLDLPSVPSVGFSPNLGNIALYRQPISYKSVAMIKKLARAYANTDYVRKIQPSLYNNDQNQNKSKII